MHSQHAQQPPKTKATKLRVPSRTAKTKKEQDAVQVAANSYCVCNYAVAFIGGTPRRLSLRHAAEVWIVPVLFTSPGYGAVGEVGVLAVDAMTHEVIGATPREEVKKAAARLATEKRDELDTAFRRARTV